MRSRSLWALAGTCVVGLLTVVTAAIPVPQVGRIALGVPLVFFLSGYAIVCAVLAGRRLSHGERALASLGLSLAMTTCVAVLLGATPIGLSRNSIAISLGSITSAISAYAWLRTRLQQASELQASEQRMEAE
jgi:uncharacterized membrane protein